MKAKYKFEEKYIGSKQTEIETTVADTTERTVFQKYQHMLKTYEEDLAELRKKESKIPTEDAVTLEDEK